jgi:DNA replication protein DnaC
LQNQIDQLRLVVIGDESDLSQSLQTQINNLKAQLALYQQQLEAINSCECDMDAVEAKLTALQTALAQKANLTDLEGLATVQQLQKNQCAAYVYRFDLCGQERVHTGHPDSGGCH